VRLIEGRPVSALLLSVVDGRIQRVFVQADPSRLSHLGALAGFASASHSRTTLPDHAEMIVMNSWLRHTLWFGPSRPARRILLFSTIAVRYLVDPVAAGAPFRFPSDRPPAITIGRVGFGGFPLAVAVILVVCLVSVRRMLTG